MATKLDVGGLDYEAAIAAATKSYTPPADRAGILHRINLSNASAKDNWILTVGQREMARFRHSTVGNQQLLAAGAGLGFPSLDFFTYCKDQLGLPVEIPVPNGLTLTLASQAGALADIDFEVEEVDAMSASSMQLNHPFGTEFLVPLSFFLNASTTTVGLQRFDTQVGPLWFPSLFNNTPLPVAWDVQILAMFFEGVGVNTFSGAANHASTTQSVQISKNGTVLYTRGLNGVPNRGKASAAGSANTVFGQQSSLYVPFQLSDWTTENKLRFPIHLRAGDALTLQLETQGDLTGGASYLDAIVNMICRVRLPSPAGSM